MAPSRWQVPGVLLRCYCGGCGVGYYSTSHGSLQRCESFNLKVLPRSIRKELESASRRWDFVHQFIVYCHCHCTVVLVVKTLTTGTPQLRCRPSCEEDNKQANQFSKDYSTVPSFIMLLFLTPHARNSTLFTKSQIHQSGG
jgi:hypothetical protein